MDHTSVGDGQVITFKATRVAATQMDDLNVFVIVLAENDDENGERLEIQRALSFDDADREHGMDTYCLCTSAGASHYGGVAGWSLVGDRLTLMLEDAAAEALNLPPKAEILLDIPDAERAPLQDALAHVLGPR